MRRGFASITRSERYRADVFYAELTGGARRQRRPTAETYDEQRRQLSLGPLSESEWEMVIGMLTRGEADVGAPLTGDANRNALLVAAKIFCVRNALDLEGGDPLMCIVSDATIADARVRAMVPLVTARGPIVNWTSVTERARVLHVMRLLTATYGYSQNAAAGLAGNFVRESCVLPQRIEGSGDRTPMRSRNFAGQLTNFTAAQVVNRNGATHTGPRLAGIGLAQWTFAGRRSALFAHAFRGLQLGARILFDMDAQVDFAVTELRSPGFAPAQNVLTQAGVTVNAASDAVALRYENPGNIAARPAADVDRVRILQQRRTSSDTALEIFRAAQNPPR